MILKREGFWNEENKPSQCDQDSKTRSKITKNFFIFKLKQIDEYITGQKPHFWMNHNLASFWLKDMPVPDINMKDYCGFSKCRICDFDRNGSADYILTSGNVQYTFPQGFLHYVDEHDIEVSEDFITFIENFDLEKCTKPLDIPQSFIMSLLMQRLNASQKGISYT